ncbi:MAG: HNH endonuclease, partial [Thermoleophilia bacterium]
AKTKLEDGRVNLSTMARAQSMIRTQEKVGKVSREEKAKAIETIENQSELKAEQSLMSLFPENASQVNRERVTVINENVQRLALNHTNEAMADLQRIKELLSHIIPGGETAEVLAYLYKDFIKRNDPLAKKAATKNTATPNTNATGAPLARRASRKVVIQEADGCCSFRDPVTGRRCGNRVRVEQDHVIPRANGGDDSIQNARLLCRAHNQYMSETILGRERANRWRTRQDFR